MFECVANFSDGRRQSVIRSVVSSLDATGCRVLDLHSDPDHHRSVVTFVGDGEAVCDGAVSLAKRAVSLIDLREHCGEHPRIGAVDVIPFVPLEGETISACVELSRRTGERIGEGLGLPVFLYESAATRDERRNLAEIRRGGLEGLAERMARPGGEPDYGPASPHPSAGAVAIGARDFLVAFNVNLSSPDLAAARRVARAVRAANGGLPGVKAIGLRLATTDRVQVSMNLTDIRATGVAVAFRRVRDEAAKLGILVSEGEFVGLVPRAALAGITAEELKLGFDLCEVILEERLR